MRFIVSRYNQDIEWVKEYTDDYVIYDRSPEPIKNAIRVPNIGSDIRDKFTYIIENYDDLPEIALFSKANIFKYITKPELDKVKDTKVFTPLLTAFHRTYMPICFYSEDGMYNEINNSWYLFNSPTKWYRNYNDYAKDFGLPITEYLKFAPGSNYILTKDNILKHPKRFYEDIREMISWSRYPGECQMVERSLYDIWK